METNHGHIQTIASLASYFSIPNLADYAASKSGVLALHEVLEQELRHRYGATRVRTSIICPLKVQTALGGALKDVPNQFLVRARAPHSFCPS